MAKLNRRMSTRAALIASAGFLLVSAGQAHAQAQSQNDFQDIIVTAQKREETLIEIPLSISVVSGDLLERRMATSFQDMLPFIPGLSLDTARPGMSRVTLRGINTGSINATIGVYIDETPYGSSSGLVDAGVLSGDIDTFDVARVEVLRGPQGTLYGANAFGGVIKYVTNEPKFDKVEARGQAGVQSTQGGNASYSGAGVLNLPLSDTFAVRASGFYRKFGGFVDSIGTAGSEIKSNINDTTSFGGRISALFKPSDAFSVRLSANIQNLKAEASSFVEADPETLAPLYGRLSQSLFSPVANDVRYRLYNGTVNLDLGFAHMMSSTSYGTLDMSLLGNLSLEYGPLLTDLFGDPVTRPLDLYLESNNRQRKFTQELRLSSPSSDRLEWLIGGYFTRETGTILQYQKAYDILAKKPATGLPLLTQVSLDSIYKEYAAFANATWHITDRLDLSLGGRYSRNEQSANQTYAGVLVGDVIFPTARSAENVFTFSVAPRFELSKNASIYARAAKGYRPGGPNVLPPLTSVQISRTYKSDTLLNYEVGFKADLLDRAFSIDVSAFYLKWKDVQLFTIIDDVGLNTNGKAAVSKGFDFTTTLRPTRGLTVSFNGAYTDARLKGDTPEIVGGLTGDRLPYTAPWSISMNSNYEWALQGATKAFVGGGFRFLSKQPADLDKDYRDAHGRQRSIASYEVIDLNAGLDFGGWTIEAFVKNLNNSRGVTSVSNPSGSVPNNAARAAFLRPRTIGLTLAATF